MSASQEGVFNVERKEGKVRIVSRRNDTSSFHQKLMDALSDDVLELNIQTDNDTIDLSFLSKCSHLDNLDLMMSSKSISGIDLSPLGLTEIKSVGLSFSGIDEPFLERLDLSFVQKSKYPEHFRVSTHSSTLGRAAFNIRRSPGRGTYLDFPKTASAAFFYMVLTEVVPEDISEISIMIPNKSINLSLLTRFAHLTELTLSMRSNEVGKMDLRVLGKLPIKVLHISLDWPSPDLSFLREIRDLESLSISPVEGRLDLSPIGDCRSLKRFKLEKNSLADVDLSPLSSCTKLEELVIRGNKPVSHRLAVPDLSRHPSMHSIRIFTHYYDVSVTSTTDLSGLTGCQSLQALELHNSSMRSLDLSPLATCTGLQQLDLRWCHSLMELDLTPLASCTGLQKLDLRDSPALKQLDLTPLGKLHMLEYLDISHACPYDGIDLMPLGTCESLRRLYVQNNTQKSLDQRTYSYEVHELDVTSLFRLRNLEYVLLFKDILGGIVYGGDLARNYPDWKVPDDMLDCYYDYLMPRKTIRQWLEQGVGLSLVRIDRGAVMEVTTQEPRVLPSFPVYELPEDLRELWLKSEPLTPRVLADSSKVPESERTPAWTKAYDIEWY